MSEIFSSNLQLLCLPLSVSLERRAVSSLLTPDSTRWSLYNLQPQRELEEQEELEGEQEEEEEEESHCQLSVCRDRLSLVDNWSRNYDQILRLAVDRTNSSIQMVSSETTCYKMSLVFIIIYTKAWLPHDPAGEDPLGGLAVFSSEGELETFLRTFTAQDKAGNVTVVEINSRLTLPS